MDPISGLVIADVGTHAAKKFIDTAIDLGGELIRKRFIDQQPKALQTAQENLGNYLNELAFRVKEIEDQLAEENKSTDQIEIALQNPDIALDFRETAIMAARTNNDVKHRLFAQLLANKLISDPENIYALSTSSAIEAIGKINLKHMRVLAVMVLFDHIQPKDIEDANPNEVLANWLSTIFGYINPGDTVTRIDFNHLMTNLCLVPKVGLVSEYPELVLVRRYQRFETEYVTKFLVEHPTGTAFKKLWDTGIVSSLLTTTGKIIGRSTFELLVKEKVEVVDWE